MSQSEDNISYKFRFLIFLVAITITRLMYISFVDLSPDEAYYWNWSRHLDLSYYDHPPMVAYVIYLSTIFNKINSEFFVRLSAVVLGTGMTYITYLFAKDIFNSEKAGFFAALWLNVTLMFSLGSIIITPDTPQSFFGILFIYFLYKAVFYNKDSNFYLSGIFLGLSLLSKYTSFLFFPAFGLFFLLLKDKRYLLKDKRIYILTILSLLVFSPVIIWNIRHDWISFSFQLSHGFGGDFREMLKNMPEFVGTQILLLTPFMFFLAIYTLVVTYKSAKKYNNDRLFFLFYSSAPILLFFLLVSFKSKIEGNWPSFSYIPLIVAIGGLTAGLKNVFIPVKNEVFFKKYVNFSLYFAVFLVLAVHLLALFPPMIVLKKTSLTKRLVGWTDMGSKLSEKINKMNSDNLFIFGNRHQVISEIAFYTDKQYQTYLKGANSRYPYMKDLSFLLGKDAIYVAEDGRSEHETFGRFFSEILELKPIDIIIDGEKVRRFLVYKCINYKGGLINV